METKRTASAAAQRRNTSEAAASHLCSLGEIPEAVQQDSLGHIPASTGSPSALSCPDPVAQAMPVGAPSRDCKGFSSSPYCADKTLFLKKLLDAHAGVYLITRPHGFGKSQNMRMLQTFFERTEEDTSACFRDTAIWSCGQRYRDHQGQYPVISLSFRGATYPTWPETYAHLCQCLIAEIQRHSELQHSDRCSAFDRQALARLVSGEADAMEYGDVPCLLSEMLSAHYGTPAIVLIEDYDVPFVYGDRMGYGQEVSRFLLPLFSAVLKDNSCIRYGFLTGTQPILLSDGCSPVNNVQYFSVLDGGFPTDFGLTADEVRQMAKAYGAEDKLDEIREWYGGYTIAGTAALYHPRSVSAYFCAGCRTAAVYWNDSGQLSAILEKAANPEIRAMLHTLLYGGAIQTVVQRTLPCRSTQRYNNPASVFSLLVHAGFLTAAETDPGSNLWDLHIPNRETAELLQAALSPCPKRTRKTPIKRPRTKA